MSDQPDEKNDVGYCKPPKSTQFKKGLSGNPKGRPKGAKGVKASLRRELETKIPIREGGRETKMSKAEILAKSLAADALKGDVKARLEILKLDDELFGDGQSTPDGRLHIAAPEAVDFDILRDFFVADGKATDKFDEESDDDCS